MTKELNKLAIGGQMRPVHFGFATLSEWCDMSNMTLNDIGTMGNNMPLSTAISMVFCALKHGARKGKVEFKYTTDDIADWLDDDQEALVEIMDLFAKSMSKTNEKKKAKGVKK
jgi:hypothetical protein|tara:strand:+ start:127 stop:465 length:339 start_codon:yes stop_codon:yes gene_type:complete